MQHYAIVDIETTGGRADRSRITEIGIVVFDGEKVISTYETLLNPDCSIPPSITRLTGITDEMVADAPRFHEVARKVVELTEGAIFVAHNVRFDYEFIREEFRRLGFTYSRRKLCTVRLSRMVFPGLPSYSLGNLIKHFGISVPARHRALADAVATTELLQMALQQQNQAETVKTMIDNGIKASRLPRNISLDQIENLPEDCGVYYFYDTNGQVIYVGKSTNIRKRIAQHFADTSTKGNEIRKEVADLSYEETGSELIALLLENQEIKRLSPRINKALRRAHFDYAIHSYVNERGYRCFDVVKNTAQARKELDLISEYPSLSSAKGRLDYLRKQLSLCSSFTHLFPSKSACFHYHIKQCKGACAGQETPEQYNQRANEAYDLLRTVFDRDFLLFDRGRTQDEKAVVLVREGHYQGFGFIHQEEAHDLQSILSALHSCPPFPDSARIIQRFLADSPAAKVLYI